MPTLANCSREPFDLRLRRASSLDSAVIYVKQRNQRYFYFAAKLTRRFFRLKSWFVAWRNFRDTKPIASNVYQFYQWVSVFLESSSGCCEYRWWGDAKSIVTIVKTCVNWMDKLSIATDANWWLEDELTHFTIHNNTLTRTHITRLRTIMFIVTFLIFFITISLQLINENKWQTLRNKINRNFISVPIL